MTSKLDHYIHAATRDNTRRSYQSAIQHFEAEWGGFLPATADSVARYLADHTAINVTGRAAMSAASALDSVDVRATGQP